MKMINWLKVFGFFDGKLLFSTARAVKLTPTKFLGLELGNSRSLPTFCIRIKNLSCYSSLRIATFVGDHLQYMNEFYCLYAFGSSTPC